MPVAEPALIGYTLSRQLSLEEAVESENFENAHAHDRE